MINEARAAIVQRLVEKRRSLQPWAPAFCSSAPWFDLGSHPNQPVWLFTDLNKQAFQYSKGLAEPLVVLLWPYLSLLIYNSGAEGDSGVRSSTPLARGGILNTWQYCGAAQVLSHICLRVRHHVSVVRAALGAAGLLSLFVRDPRSEGPPRGSRVRQTDVLKISFFLIPPLEPLVGRSALSDFPTWPFSH